MDQTERFLVTSSRGNKYIMFIYDHNSNAILPEPMKSRSKHKLIRAYSSLQSKLTKRGLRPTFQTLYNEFPAALKSFMRKEGITFKLVPSHLNHTNAVERAIQTFKDHFLQPLAAVTQTFPSIFGVIFYRKLQLH